MLIGASVSGVTAQHVKRKKNEGNAAVQYTIYCLDSCCFLIPTLEYSSATLLEQGARLTAQHVLKCKHE